MKRIHLWLEEHHLRKIDTLAKQAGRSRSAIARLLIENATICEMPTADYFAMIDELRRIGVNLNQIAAAANAAGHINATAYASTVTELRRAVLDIKKAVELR